MTEKLYLYVKKQSVENGEPEYLNLDTDEFYSFTKDKNKASLKSQEDINSLFVTFDKNIIKSWNLQRIRPNQIDFIPKVEELNRWNPATFIADMINNQNEMGYNFAQFENNDYLEGMHNFLKNHKKDFEDKGYTILLNINYNDFSKQDVILWGSDTQ